MNNRLKQLQTGNGNGLFLSAIYECEYPFRLEALLHRKFSYCRESGEWFRLDVDKVVNFKKICEETDKIIHLMKDNPFFCKDLK